MKRTARVVQIVAFALTLISASTKAQQQAPSLGQYLNTDGTLNLPPGFSGSLDPKGWKMRTASNGEPRFARSVTSVPADSSWDEQFYLINTNGNIGALAVNGTDLYIGGGFTSVGGITTDYIL